MAIRTKSQDRVVAKYVARASVAQPEYIQGINDAGNAWEQNASAANETYKTAVIQAANAGRYSQGIREAGNSKWQSNALQKGPARFVEGVNLGQGEYASQIAKVLTTIQGVTLPARGPKGSPQNFQRIQPIGEALRRAFGKAGGTGTR
ncbi:hypothetical protein LCGC14_0920780 [marine sediment metagenome]|uniref:Uncharacterized protein n=1 Tax=marine sediment metagenome TaxID=412755 RepID=A0A0F9PBK4_9ZZZZ